jgi:hypothetical protein
MASDGAVGSESDLTLAAQRTRWHGQVSAVPNLQCAKDEITALTHHLVAGINAGQAADLDLRPLTIAGEARRPWRDYVPPLRVMGLVVNNRGVLSLTEDGDRFLRSNDPLLLAGLLADRVRLFAEVLELLVREPLTVQEVNDRLVSTYNLPWKTENNTRVRMTWLEVLGLTEWLGERKQGATAQGREVIATWTTVSPEALEITDAGQLDALPDAPSEIESLLADLRANPAGHLERSTYNIWVPSPSSDPNKIENMRIAIAAAATPIGKNELLGFIADRFGLKRSSVESMLPFMRAGGFLQEVQRGVFVATSAAKAWIESGSEFNFVRLLHANMRFVGELVLFAVENTPRNNIYSEAVRYGLNKEKARWLMNFMLDAGLMIETSFTSVQASATGLRLAAELPLAPDPGSAEEGAAVRDAGPLVIQLAERSGESSGAARIAETLRSTATDPGAEGKAPGVGFEEAIRDAFTEMGFIARRISGSGDTDVLVQWTASDGEPRTAVVDGKSTSSGRVVHTNVSDVALDTHKEKNSADYVAIVGPAFGGDTIQTMAQKRGWALVTAEELARVVIASEDLGLAPAEVGLLFDPAEGKSALTDLIATKERDLDIVSLVISRLRKESEGDEPLSPRDISLIERASDINPTVGEVRETFELFERLSFGIVRSVEASTDARFATYEIGDARPAARQLRALADAIEAGLQDAP